VVVGDDDKRLKFCVFFLILYRVEVDAEVEVALVLSVVAAFADMVDLIPRTLNDKEDVNRVTIIGNIVTMIIRLLFLMICLGEKKNVIEYINSGSIYECSNNWS
jgi:formate-dependent nitrite reductase membrane component NrfD